MKYQQINVKSFLIKWAQAHMGLPESFSRSLLICATRTEEYSKLYE